MFLIPSGDAEEKSRSDGDRLLSWSDARRLPWGLLLLFGGGIAIAQSYEYCIAS